MKIAIVGDQKHFGDWIRRHNLFEHENKFKVVNCPRHIDGFRFDYFHVIYTHLDIGDSIKYLEQLSVPELRSIDEIKNIL